MKKYISILTILLLFCATIAFAQDADCGMDPCAPPCADCTTTTTAVVETGTIPFSIVYDAATNGMNTQTLAVEIAEPNVPPCSNVTFDYTIDYTIDPSIPAGGVSWTSEAFFEIIDAGGAVVASGGPTLPGSMDNGNAISSSTGGSSTSLASGFAGGVTLSIGDTYDDAYEDGTFFGDFSYTLTIDVIEFEPAPACSTLAPGACGCPAVCETQLFGFGGAGYAICQDIQDSFDNACTTDPDYCALFGPFGGFPGFSAAQDPCTFCSASSIAIDFGTQPSQACVDELAALDFETYIVQGYNVALDGCNLPADAVLAVDCPNPLDGFANAPYTGDGCLNDYYTWVQRFDIPDAGSGCPCSGTCYTVDPVTIPVPACTPNNNACDMSMLMLTLEIVDGTCDVAPTLNVIADCMGTPVDCPVIVDYSEVVPMLGCPDNAGSGMLTANVTLDDPGLNGALMAAGVSLDPHPCPLAEDLPISYNCACCDQVYDFSIEDICSGGAPVLVSDAAICDPGTLDPFGLELDLDIYLYAPGGVPSQAAACYLPTDLVATGIYNVFPLSDPDLINVGGVGGTWNGTICADFTAPALINNTCDPITVTYVVVPWDRDFDSDGDGTNGEYNITTPGSCGITCYDVVIWPDGLTAVETPGTCEGNPSSVVIQAANGDQCVTDAAAAAPANPVCPTTAATDMFMYEFTAADLGLDMAPMACQPSFTGQIDVPCTAVCCDIMDPTTMPAEICEGDAAMSLTASPGGATCTTINWFSDAAGMTMVGSGTTFTPTDVAAGTYTYYAQCVNDALSDCESNLIPAVYTINATPVVSLDTPSFGCGDGAQALNSMPAGGTYSGSGAAVVNADSITETDLTPGVVYDLTYTVTTADGCTDSTTIQFSFDPACDADGGSF